MDSSAERFWCPFLLSQPSFLLSLRPSQRQKHMSTVREMICRQIIKMDMCMPQWLLASYKENNNTSKDIEELVKQKLALEADIAQKEIDIKIKSGEIKSLQSELDTLAATLRQLENQKGEAQKRLNDLRAQKSEIDKEMEEVVTEITEESTKVEKLRAQAAEQAEAVAAREAELNSKKEQLEGLRQEELRLEQQKNESASKLQNLTSNLQDTQLSIISQTKALITQLQEQTNVTSLPDTALRINPDFRDPEYTTVDTDNVNNNKQAQAVDGFLLNGVSNTSEEGEIDVEIIEHLGELCSEEMHEQSLSESRLNNPTEMKNKKLEEYPKTDRTVSGDTQVKEELLEGGENIEDSTPSGSEVNIPERNLDETVDEDVDEDENRLRLEICNGQMTANDFEKLKSLSIKISWEVPKLHTIETRVTAPPKSDQRKEISKLKVQIKSGNFNRDEDEQIKSNWQEFCRLHDMTKDPTPFIDFSWGKTSPWLPTSERIKFVRFLAHGLDNRPLHSVYRRFQRLFSSKDIKRGRFTEEEDETIRIFLKKTKSRTPYCELAKILNRDRSAVFKRSLQLKDNVGNQRVKWSNKKIKRFLKYCLKITRSNIDDLKYKQFSQKELLRLSKKMKIPVSKLRLAWSRTIHPRIFINQSVSLRTIKSNVLQVLTDKEEDDWRDVNWGEVAKSFQGLTSYKLNTLFKRTVRVHVPEEKQKNLKDCLEYLNEFNLEDHCRAHVLAKLHVDDDVLRRKKKEVLKDQVDGILEGDK